MRIIDSASSNLYQLGKIQGVLSFLENISYTATTPEFNSNQVKNCLGICKLLMPDKCFFERLLLWFCPNLLCQVVQRMGVLNEGLFVN